MGFFLFILVNALLFIRPAEVFGIEELENVYQILILACLAFSLPDVLACLLGRPLDMQPITVCVLAISILIPLPFLAAADGNEAFRTWFTFFKVVIYYVLLISLVNSGRRLRIFMACVLMFCMVLALASVLNIHGIIHLENLKTATEGSEDLKTGENTSVERLMGTGLFQDPNEMCVILAALLPLTLYFLSDPRRGVVKMVMLANLFVFAYAIILTDRVEGCWPL